MSQRILLLDCSAELSQQLKGENFDVSVGSIGFATGIRKLPHPIYEAEVIVYNPVTVKEVSYSSPITGGDLKRVIRPRDIKGSDTGIFLNQLSAHLHAGGIFLVFVNHLTARLDQLQSVYDWIPSMPKLLAASDSKLVIANIESQPVSAPYQPLLDETRILKPVRLRLESDVEEMLNQEVLVSNSIRKELGCVFKLGKGQLIVLPTFRSNDEIVLDFIHRVVPQLMPVASPKAIVDRYLNPDERYIAEQITELTRQIQELEKIQKNLIIESKALERVRRTTIKDDRISCLLVNYLERALQEPKYALFHLYKIVETIEESAGGESKVNPKYGCKKECKLIGRIANASYGDERHAPKSADVIKPWSKDEIADCFEAARAIIVSYFDSLFVLEKSSLES